MGAATRGPVIKNRISVVQPVDKGPRGYFLFAELQMTATQLSSAHGDLRAFEVALAEPSFTRVIADAGGPPLWHTLHNLARAYKPSTQKDLMATWLRTTAALMWCEHCAQHFGEMVKDADLNSAPGFLAWTVRVHNAVNARLGKPVVSDEAAIASIRAAAAPPHFPSTGDVKHQPETNTARGAQQQPETSIARDASMSAGWKIATIVLACGVLILIGVCAWLALRPRRAPVTERGP